MQRDLRFHFWGWATPGELVTASFRGQIRTATTNELGQWSVYLPPGNAGGPYEAVIKGSNTITLDDVLVGDVWIAGGQSNMEFEPAQWLRPRPLTCQNPGNPNIRLTVVRKVYSTLRRPMWK